MEQPGVVYVVDDDPGVFNRLSKHLLSSTIMPLVLSECR